MLHFSIDMSSQKKKRKCEEPEAPARRSLHLKRTNEKKEAKEETKVECKCAEEVRAALATRGAITDVTGRVVKCQNYPQCLACLGREVKTALERDDPVIAATFAKAFGIEEEKKKVECKCAEELKALLAIPADIPDPTATIKRQEQAVLKTAQKFLAHRRIEKCPNYPQCCSGLGEECKAALDRDEPVIAAAKKALGVQEENSGERKEEEPLGKGYLSGYLYMERAKDGRIMGAKVERGIRGSIGAVRFADGIDTEDRMLSREPLLEELHECSEDQYPEPRQPTKCDLCRNSGERARDIHCSRCDSTFCEECAGDGTHGDRCTMTEEAKH